MKKIVLFPIALAAVAISCNKLPEDNGDPASETGMITEVISGSRGSATKATIAETDASIFKWSIGDNLAVHVSKGTTHKYVVTSEGASVAEAAASFSVSYEDGFSRDAFAIFPSTIVDENAASYGQSGSALEVTLPSRYILDQVSDETAPCPMIADNTGTSWTFYQLCSMLRLTVEAVPSATKRLDIIIEDGPDRICGGFKISGVPGGSINPQEAILIPSNNASGGGVISIVKDGTDTTFGAESLVINIPLPADDKDPYTSITVNAYNATTGGSFIAAATLPFNYTASKTNATKRTVSFAPATAFRGYEVSTGILERNSSTSPATYSLTSGEMVRITDPVTGEWTYALPAGCNPFVQASYYGKDASRNKYYISWTTLKNELGADGNNIDSASDKLPSGWRFPTGNGGQSLNTTDWSVIVFGAPKSAIKVNGTAVTGRAYAMVTVTLDDENSYGVDAGSYLGMLLLRDGSTIPSGLLNTWGQGSKYADNPLNETMFQELIQLGCLFISNTGYYNSGWKYPEDMHYWTSLYKDGTNSYELEDLNSSGVCFSTFNNGREVPVRLVKQL